MKKFKVIFATLLLMIPLLVLTACGNNDSASFTFELTQDGGSGYVVTSFIGNETEVEIPSTYKGKPVKGIDANAFEDCVEITSVVIPSSILKIEDYAFKGCTGLLSVNIPDSVTTIGNEAFMNCSSVLSVTLGSGLIGIAGSAFRNCTSLTKIIIPSTVNALGGYAFGGSTSLTIFCQASSKPSGWAATWNGERPVYWSSEWTLIGGVPFPLPS